MKVFLIQLITKSGERRQYLALQPDRAAALAHVEAFQKATYNDPVRIFQSVQEAKAADGVYEVAA